MRDLFDYALYSLLAYSDIEIDQNINLNSSIDKSFDDRS